MKFALSLTVVAAMAAAAFAASPRSVESKVVYTPLIPDGAVPFASAKVTQAIGITNEQDTIIPVPISQLPDKRWQQPGGLEGITGWTQQKYRYIPTERRVRHWIGNIGVRNSYGYIQQNRGILREYPNGTRFDEVLINSKTGIVFEHRVREKIDGAWKSEVHHKDESQFPTGYTGLKVTCGSCHNETATGGYAVGLVPGGDTVLSDPLEGLEPAALKEIQPRDGVAPPVVPQPMQPKTPAPMAVPPVVQAQTTQLYLVPAKTGLFGRSRSACASSTFGACGTATFAVQPPPVTFTFTPPPVTFAVAPSATFGACGTATRFRQRTVTRSFGCR